MAAATQEANRLGVAAPQTQQVAAAAVAESRGEHTDERLTPQAVFDARAEERASSAPSEPPLVQEQRTSVAAERVRESARPEAPRQEPAAATASAKVDHSTEQKARTDATAPSEQSAPSRALAMGKVEQSDVQELEVRQAPTQAESSSPEKVAQSEPAERQQAAVTTPVLPSQPSHPDHALYQQIRDGVAALDASHGRSFDAVSERMTASLLVLAKDNDLGRVDHVLLSSATPDKAAGHSLFVVQGEPSDPAHQRAAMPTELAAQTSVAESMQQFEVVSREAQHRAHANQLEQQLEDQRVQQNSHARAASMG